jgi:hypothetical protein
MSWTEIIPFWKAIRSAPSEEEQRQTHPKYACPRRRSRYEHCVTSGKLARNGAPHSTAERVDMARNHLDGIGCRWIKGRPTTAGPDNQAIGRIVEVALCCRHTELRLGYSRQSRNAEESGKGHHTFFTGSKKFLVKEIEVFEITE